MQYEIGVDLTADHPRFVFHHPTWGWPFRWPKVSELAVASDEDGLLWKLEATNPAGQAAQELVIVYGEAPDGFSQVEPQGNARPKMLTRGRVYYVGATGPGAVFRAVFALPVGRYGRAPRSDWVPGAQRADIASEQAKPADWRASCAPCGVGCDAHTHRRLPHFLCHNFFVTPSLADS